MHKIIISLMVLLITPLTVQADHHATSGPGEGSFTTLMVQAPDVSAYIKHLKNNPELFSAFKACLLYTSPSPRDGLLSRMPSSA